MKASTLAIVAGVLALIGGIIALIFPLPAGLALTVFIGWAFIVSGVVGLWAGFSDSDLPDRWWVSGFGLMQLVLGIWLLANPLGGLVSLTIALGIAGALAVTAVLFWQRAVQANHLATSRELAAAAITNLSVDPERSVLLALRALDAANTLEARNALHQAIPELHILLNISAHPGGVSDVAFSPNGALLASIGADGVVYAEVRMAPELCTEQGLTLDEVVEAMLTGFRRGAAGTDLTIYLICSAMRTAARSLEIAELAVRWRDAGCVGFDIAGAEAGYPPTCLLYTSPSPRD